MHASDIEAEIERELAATRATREADDRATAAQRVRSRIAADQAAANRIRQRHAALATTVQAFARILSLETARASLIEELLANVKQSAGAEAQWRAALFPLLDQKHDRDAIEVASAAPDFSALVEALREVAGTRVSTRRDAVLARAREAFATANRRERGEE
jgi:hypothetical protein